MQSSIVHNDQKQNTMQTFTDWWRNKQMSLFHTMEYCLAAERNAVLLHATWMNPEHITLSGRSQTPEEKYYEISFTWKG